MHVFNALCVVFGFAEYPIQYCLLILIAINTFRSDTGVFAITSPVIVSSNNYSSNFATIGDRILLEFSASRAIASLPTVLIAGRAATLINIVGPRYIAAVNVTAALPEGLVSILISDYTDEAGNKGENRSTVAGDSFVMIGTHFRVCIYV